jgi:hypothetical protein
MTVENFSSPAANQNLRTKLKFKQSVSYAMQHKNLFLIAKTDKILSHALK